MQGPTQAGCWRVLPTPPVLLLLLLLLPPPVPPLPLPLQVLPSGSSTRSWQLAASAPTMTARCG